MKRAIQFGAGNIGRGFIGAVLSEAGYHVVFADVNMEVIDRINKDGAYTVHIMDVESRDVRISDISGVDSGGGEIVDEIVRAEIITTAVGLRILPFIAPAIAKGIAARRAAGVGEPLNVIACENGIRATSQLREEVYKHLSTEEAAWCDAHVGFADCSVDRIVPPVRSENPIDVVVENFYEWNVEEKSFVGGAPHIEGMNLADNLLAYIERKLFTLNTGHAITAYLGRMKGLATIDESIADPAIFAIVKEAMQQSGQALVEKFGFDRDAHFKYIDKIIGRIYPIFGAILMFSALGVFIGLFVKGYPLLNLAGQADDDRPRVRPAVRQTAAGYRRRTALQQSRRSAERQDAGADRCQGAASGRVGDHVDPRDRSRHRGDRRRYGRGRKTNPLSRLQSYEETFHRSDRADACDCNLVYLRRGGASRVGETASHRSDQ